MNHAPIGSKIATGTRHVIKEGGGMSNATSYETAVCAQYEILLNECEATLERWDDRHEEINWLRLSGKEIGDEWLRLQANYAKAHAELRRHVQDCEICQFLGKIAGRNSDYTVNLESRKKARI